MDDMLGVASTDNAFYIANSLLDVLIHPRRRKSWKWIGFTDRAGYKRRGGRAAPRPNDTGDPMMGKYSETLMEHFTSPRNSGAMESPDLVGHSGTPGNGPFLILYLRMDGATIRQARFQNLRLRPDDRVGLGADRDDHRTRGDRLPGDDPSRPHRGPWMACRGISCIARPWRSPRSRML